MRAPMMLLPLVIAAVLLTSPSPGQVVEEENSETMQAGAGNSPREQTLNLARVAELIIEGTNEFRAEQDRSPVEPDSELMATAQYFAGYMARTDKYGHTADGQRPAQRATEHGYDYCIISENIAYAYRSTGFTEKELSRQFVEGWINSPEHRKNMVDPAVTEIGVAVAHSEQSGNNYAVQMFGRPKSMSIQFSVVNRSGETIRYQIGERLLPLPPRFTRTHAQCRPSEVKFQLASGENEKQKTKTVEPESGDRFVIEEENGELQVEETR